MNVLVVDDHLGFLAAVKNTLVSLGVSVATASSAEQGLAYLRARHWDVLLLDIRMPDHDGVWVLDHASLPSDTRVIPISGYIPPDVAQRLETLGAERPLLKPFGLPELAAAIHRTEDLSGSKGRSTVEPHGKLEDQVVP